MQCPACSATLQMMERQGIEIDYCPRCRGVWLDRGELDKIIERSAGPSPVDRPERRPPAFDHGDEDDYRPRRRRSWLEELFD